MFSKPSITFSNGVLTINTNINGCTICLTSEHDAGNSYFEVVSDTSVASFNIPLHNKYKLCITKSGYAPFIATIYRQAFIQNETITSEVIGVSESKINFAASGQVIESGKTTIQVDNSVTIKNNFEVIPNAEFEIKVPE